MIYQSLACILAVSFLMAEHPIKNIGGIDFKKVCDSPEVYICDHFISDEECDYIIKVSKPTLERSTVVDYKSKDSILDNRRTSLGTFLMGMRLSDPTIKNITARVESVTAIPGKNGEDLQVLYYGVGGEYQPHFDYFDPATVGGGYHHIRGGQRVATLILYLNTVEKGGETIFPRADLQIKPIKGRALLFFNVDDLGKENPLTLHGGAPVIAGEKWIATLWMRERTFN